MIQRRNRRSDGAVHPEYAAIRISFGFPPGDIPAAPLS